MKNIEATSWLSKICRARANERGNAIVEMSLLMLPFILLIMAVMEFGWFYFHQHTVQFATREGMRMALVGEVLNDEQGDPLSREASIILKIRQNASWAMDSFNEDVFKIMPAVLQPGNYVDPDDFTDPNAAPNAGNPADYMRIQVLYGHKFFNPLLGSLFPTTQNPNPNDPCIGEENCVTLRAEVTYRNELFLSEEV